MTRFHRSKAVLILAIVVPLLVIAFVAVAFTQARDLADAQARLQATTTQRDDLAAQRDYWRDAYRVGLNDLLRVSDIYGGGHIVLANALTQREQSLRVTHPRYDLAVWDRYGLQEPGRLTAALASGTVSHECMPDDAIEAETLDRRVFLLVDADLPGTLVVDGNELAVLRETPLALDVELREGVHEVTVVMPEGGAVRALRVEYDDALLSAVLDRGVVSRPESFMDCSDAATVAVLRENNDGAVMAHSPGAMRVRVLVREAAQQ